MSYEDFLNERKYLLNVSPKTLVYYKNAFNAWDKHNGDGKPATWIKNMLESGIKPVSVNTYICAMNAYWKWSGTGQKLKYIKEEEKVLATLDKKSVELIIAWRPPANATNLRRAHLVALTILDTGLRISEVLGLTKEDADLDNLVLKVKGKGSKYRLVPFSTELRRQLWRTMVQGKIAGRLGFLFGTKNNTQVTVRNFNRDFQVLGQKLGISGVRFSPHTLRHTFAVNWLRKGGDIYMLSRMLGHANIQTTTIYLKSLGVNDIAPTAQRVSLLSR